ncbi:type II and III secretion system protein family protein [Sphingomonas qomolangmaensis]|uniref:Type II and III secretion system protein family protein n=1 Tax=Sphingomonas qomolangmaensis TaxID=2918765 RepID=A0ABY5L366_9SPHN|nr:type II and III secretion system protein family protein [Sphingomonas qomolangmaensis]UUL81395.1 type II and III secretion system protein family protein [Sphingomonas qomolangmaensis]
MTKIRSSLRTALVLATASGAIGASMPTAAQNVSSPSEMLQLSTGRGQLVTVREPITDVFVASDGIADVTVRSPTQFWVFGKKAGETTVYAVTRAGKVAYSSNLRVGNNFDSVGGMLNLAMPEANITATPMNGLILLTGTIANPSDGAEAERLVQAFVGEETKVVSRLRTATPLQVNLQVRIAEVSRSFVKNIGVNLTNRDGGSFLFGLAQGRQGSITTVPGVPGQPNAPVDANGQVPGGSLYRYPAQQTGSTLLGAAGRFLGTDLLASLDLGETIGQVTTLANPNLTALSGETATFLAGGEIPIPISQGLGAVSVQYKQYGVSLAYTPTVLADGRISLRVRPEVSELSSAGAVTIEGVQVPALTTRRAETTIELGSGQSFMIAGLLQNNHNNQIEKTPGVGDLPILGALFRSNGFRRQETELVIVVTPYLVKPIDGNQIALPTDGYQSPTDVERILLGQLNGGGPAGERPKPSMAPPTVAAPSFGASAPVLPAGPALPGRQLPTAAPLPDPFAAAPQEKPRRKPKKAKGDVAPGFSVN